MASFFTVFIFGLLAAFLALIIEIVTAVNPLTFKLDSTHSVGLYTAYWFSLAGLLPLMGIACIEEGVRFIFLRQFILRFRASTVEAGFREKLLFGIAFGLGFASLEAFLILDGEHIIPTVQLIGIALLHISMSTLLSFFLLKSPTPKLFLIFLALSLVILLHTLYNLGILLFF